VELGRAMIARPKMLMLDEPAAGLNHGEVDELGDLILRLKQHFDLSILLVEHHMSLVMRVSDRVVALDLLASLTVGWLVVRAAATGHWMYVDVALGIGLVSVVGTVAFGAFTEHRAREAAGEDRS
jgi:multisubunit Na+/H+ antiporter MnhF subunit